MTAATVPGEVRRHQHYLHAARSNRATPAIALAGVCAVAAFTEAGADDGLVLCPYRLATGGWCPGCGCTRALGALIRGDVSGSFAYNPWSMILLAQATVVTGWVMAAPESAKAWWRHRGMQLIVANLVLAFLIWIPRLIGGVIPLPFS